MRNDGAEKLATNNALCVLGLVGLIVMALLDWTGGETVRRVMWQGDGTTQVIITDYGWSGIPWREWEE